MKSLQSDILANIKIHESRNPDFITSPDLLLWPAPRGWYLGEPGVPGWQLLRALGGGGQPGEPQGAQAQLRRDAQGGPQEETQVGRRRNLVFLDFGWL